jgi:hypothetical protein
VSRYFSNAWRSRTLSALATARNFVRWIGSAGAACERYSRIHADTGHSAGQCGCHRVLDGWNAEKAILEVESYLDAITLSAQTL